MKAWELIQKNGWCQNTYARYPSGIRAESIYDPLNQVYRYPENCSFCLVGAIRQTYRNRVTVANKVKEVNRVLLTDQDYSDYAGANKETPNYEYAFPAGFNDLETTTQEDIITLLKKADV